MSKHRLPKVFTLPSADVDPERLKQWRENWNAAGYEPIVIPSTVITSPRLKHFINRMDGKNVEMPTFLKWFAVASACDYDEFVLYADVNVFNYGFIPDMRVGKMAKTMIVLFEQDASTVFLGGKLNLSRQCEMFCHYTPTSDKPITDEDIIRHQMRNAPDRFATVGVCLPYDIHGWDTAALVRYDAHQDPKTLRDWTQKPKTAEVAA